MDCCHVDRSAKRCVAVALWLAALLVPCSGAISSKTSSSRDLGPREQANIVFKSILYCLHQTSDDHRPWLYSVTQRDAGNLEVLSKLLRAQGFSRVDPDWTKAGTSHKQFFYADVEGWNPVVKGRTSIRIHALYDNHRSEVLHEFYATVVFKYLKSGWRIDRHASKVEVGE